MNESRRRFVSDAVDELERLEQRRRLLMEVWRFLEGYLPPRVGAPPGTTRARSDVVREMQSECIVASAVARRRMDRILKIGTGPDGDVDPHVDAHELFARTDDET